MIPVNPDGLLMIGLGCVLLPIPSLVRIVMGGVLLVLGVLRLAGKA